MKLGFLLRRCCHLILRRTIRAGGDSGGSGDNANEASHIDVAADHRRNLHHTDETVRDSAKLVLMAKLARKVPEKCL